MWCGCTNKKYLKTYALFSLVEPYFSAYGNSHYGKRLNRFKLFSYRHTGIRLRKIARLKGISFPYVFVCLYDRNL